MELKKIFVYCRKSQESEERQALSIPSQIEVLEKIAKRDGYVLVKPYYQESQSAKKPGRPVFNKMLKDMEEQQVKRVLVWNPDRLSRNSVDTGQIIYLMDRNVLDEIITPTQVFKNNPNDKFLFNILCGQAKLENDNRGINAKRGMTTKANMGWYPAPAPLGYKNTPERKKDFKIIIKDDERFNLVKKMFTEIVNGKQPIKVYYEAVGDWKLTNKYGKKLSRSAFYYILNNPFYYGEYEWSRGSGNWYKGNHEAMISKDEFDMVQKALGKNGKPISRTQAFDLTGLFRCQECGCAMSATRKVKHYKRTGRICVYTYYHCTKKNPNIKCHAKPIREDEVLKQIDEILIKIRPDQKFVDWTSKWLSNLEKSEESFYEETIIRYKAKLSNLEKRQNNLLDMKLDETIDDQTYKEKKESIEKEKIEIESKLDDSKNGLDSLSIKIETTLDFAKASLMKFDDGSREDKHKVLLTIGENLFLKTDRTLEIRLKPAYQVLFNQDKWDSQYKERLEPQKYTEIMAKNSDLLPANPNWLRLVDAFCNHKIEFSVNLQLLQNFFTDWQLTPSFA